MLDGKKLDDQVWLRLLFVMRENLWREDFDKSSLLFLMKTRELLKSKNFSQPSTIRFSIECNQSNILEIEPLVLNEGYVFSIKFTGDKLKDPQLKAN